MARLVARDVSTFNVEAEPTAVFVCHLCPFRAEPGARAPTAPLPPPTFTTASITTRNVSLRYARPVALSLHQKTAARVVFQNFHEGHQWRRGIDSQRRDFVPGPPRRFSRIRLGRHEFATLFRHGLLPSHSLSTFSPLLSSRTTDIGPSPLNPSPHPPSPLLPFSSSSFLMEEENDFRFLPLCAWRKESLFFFRSFVRSGWTDGFGRASMVYLYVGG